MFVHASLAATGPERRLLSWFVHVVQPRATVLDIGAHAGWLSLLAAKQTGRTGRVVAFEPTPSLTRILRFNKRVNFARNLTVEQAAVTDSCGQGSFFLARDGDGSLNSLFEDAVAFHEQNSAAAEHDRIECATWSLDEYCERQHLAPDVIKIDVEGAELLVLQGARRILKEYKPILIIAVHPPLMPKKNPQDLFSLLHDFGYAIRDSETHEFAGAEWGDYLLECRQPALVLSRP